MTFPFVRHARYHKAVASMLRWKQKARELHAQVRAVAGPLQARIAGLEAELKRADAALQESRAEARSLREAFQRLQDDELFRQGRAPIFNPESPMYRPRTVTAQEVEPRPLHMTPSQWRARAEQMAREAYEREQQAEVKATLAEGETHGG